ncbi:hypothetical protein Taro_024414 [Colocasia esculenta]|uniref:Uncharacterized protein n=1 Tax=Colocasia esculenta TaxID=4460 RepID=A0A843VDL0_COLES|nr:hypothetical protein [Colocasia esculenta]
MGLGQSAIAAMAEFLVPTNAPTCEQCKREMSGAVFAERSEAPVPWPAEEQEDENPHLCPSEEKATRSLSRSRRRLSLCRVQEKGRRHCICRFTRYAFPSPFLFQGSQPSTSTSPRRLLWWQSRYFPNPYTFTIYFKRGYKSRDYSDLWVSLVVLTPSASRPTNDFVGLVSYSGDASCVDVISFKTYGKLRWPGFIFWGCQLYGRHQPQDPRITLSAWFHLLGTPIVLTSSASRPTNDFVGLVSSSGEVGYVDAISFKTYGKLRRPGFIIWGHRLCGRHQLQDLRMTSSAWFHHLGTSVMWTPLASRPTNDFIGLVSSFGDVGCVDTISFKTYGKLRRPGFIIWGHRLYRRHQLQDLRETPSAWFHHLGTSVMWTPSASRPTGNSVGLVSSSGDVGCMDAISFKTYGKLCRPGFIIWGCRLC